jgi:hypothetical protein
MHDHLLPSPKMGISIQIPHTRCLRSTCKIPVNSLSNWLSYGALAPSGSRTPLSVLTSAMTLACSTKPCEHRWRPPAAETAPGRVHGPQLRRAGDHPARPDASESMNTYIRVRQQYVMSQNSPLRMKTAPLFAGGHPYVLYTVLTWSHGSASAIHLCCAWGPGAVSPARPLLRAKNSG